VRGSILTASVLLVANFLLSGCATTPQRETFYVSVSGLAGHSTNSAVSFVILPGDKNITVTDLQFQEYAGVVERAMSQHGFRRTPSFEDADMAIFLAYGIGEPKEHVYSFSLPVFGQTGISSATTYGNISGSAYGFGNTAYGSANYSGTTYYTPSYGITGYSSHIGTLVTYTRHIFIEAVDLPIYRSQNKVVQLWKTGIVSVGSSGDLRRVFPVMVGAATPHLSTNTGQVRMVELFEDDPRVLFVKGIPVEKKK